MRMSRTINAAACVPTQYTHFFAIMTPVAARVAEVMYCATQFSNQPIQEHSR